MVTNQGFGVHDLATVAIPTYEGTVQVACEGVVWCLFANLTDNANSLDLARIMGSS